MADAVRKARFSYQPLSTARQEIRLIKVLKLSENCEEHPQDTICCEVSHYSLDEVGFVDDDDSILATPHSFRRWLDREEAKRLELASTQENRDDIINCFRGSRSSFEDALKMGRNKLPGLVQDILRENGLSWEQATADRRRTPSYKALSYTWGPEHPLHTICLNGHEFQVRRNLYDFLSRMQR